MSRRLVSDFGPFSKLCPAASVTAFLTRMRSLLKSTSRHLSPHISSRLRPAESPRRTARVSSLSTMESSAARSLWRSESSRAFGSRRRLFGALSDFVKGLLASAPVSTA